jgi:branched-subunit amino acid aminotransferase/4-amino-4-deoxychorismate lyase
LGLPLEQVQLPDAQAVFDLIEANRAFLTPAHDVRLRITLSGGLAGEPASESVLWMTAGRLPPPIRESGAFITFNWPVVADDFLAKHKTLNYWRKQITQGHAAGCLSDDVLFVTPAGLVCETSRANIFLVDGGRLSTPGADGPLLAGVMRGVVLERAKLLGLDVVCGPLPRERIATADEAFLTNSVRGMLPIARLLDRELPSPGPVTRQLWSDVSQWLESGGKTS